MLRRGIALALWAYFGWYLGSMIAAFTGLPSTAGPVLALLVAGFALIDWRRPPLFRRETPRKALEPTR